MVCAGTHGVSARRSSNMMCMLDEKCCATRCNEGVCNACMCRDSRFKQPDMRAARSPTAPGYTAVGMSLHAQPACECVLGRTLAPTRCPGIRATSPAPASHHATTWCSATRPQSPWSVRRAVGACSSGAFFAPGQMPPAAKGSADTGRASACTLRRNAVQTRAAASLRTRGERLCGHWQPAGIGRASSCTLRTEIAAGVQELLSHLADEGEKMSGVALKNAGAE